MSLNPKRSLNKHPLVSIQQTCALVCVIVYSNFCFDKEYRVLSVLFYMYFQDPQNEFELSKISFDECIIKLYMVHYILGFDNLYLLVVAYIFLFHEVGFNIDIVLSTFVTLLRTNV